jgi:RNA polymerase sigma-70 factor (ECF subfamily)
MVTDPTRDVMGDSMGGAPGPVASDADLVTELIGGSHDALAALYDRHSGAVFAAAMRASRDHWIASEVVQETFLAFWDRAERFDPSKGSLAGWLSTIARNRAIDHLRAAGRHHRAATFSSFGAAADDHTTVEWLTASGELVGSASPEPVPELALTAKETRAAIQDAMATLDPVERSVIELAYAGGLTQVEIASQLGWPLGTVKTRTRRALQHLRDRLETPPVAVLPVAVPCSSAVGASCA